MFKLVVLYNPEMELWKDIPEFMGVYQASTYGRVRSMKRGKWKILKPGAQTHNYYNYVLMKDGNRITYRAHRLIYSTFRGTIPDGMQVNHMDADVHNNSIWNLNLLTNKENYLWSIKRTNTQKPIIQKTIDGTFVKKYESVIQASRETKFNRANISLCAQGKYKQAYGFLWEYVI